MALARRLAASAFVLAWLLPGGARATPRAWTPADAASIPWLFDVRIAPGGGEAIVAWSRSDLASPQPTMDIEHVSLADGKLTPVPRGESGLGQPRWSPQGDRIAWLADTPKGSAQLVVTGPLGASPRPLTSGERAVVQFSWSPDGRQIAAVETPAGGREAPRMRWLGVESDVVGSTPPSRDVYLLDVATGAERLLTHDGWSYGGPATDHDPSWSADGAELAMTRQPSSLYGDFEHAEYVRVSTRDGSVRPLLDRPFFAYPSSPGPLFSPEGHGVALVHTWDGKLPSREDLYVDGRDVTGSLDRDLWSCSAGQLDWQPHMLVATIMDGMSVRLFRLDERGRAPVPLTPGAGTVGTFSVARTGRIAYAWSSPTSPPELFVLDPGKAPRQVTHRAAPEGLPVAPTRDVSWATVNDLRLHGQLTVPARGPLRDAPLVVELHGGPQCAEDATFDADAQYLADHGFALFRPNPRGSDGYGDWSYKAIVKDWGDGPMADVLAGVDAVLASGVSRPGRLFVEGASYGGYLTSWIVSHSDRFAAASAQVPVADLLLEYTLSESPNILRRFFGDQPTTDQALLVRESPVTFAGRVHTPLLVTIGLRDTRAPYAQAIALYKAVAEGGGETRLLADAQSGHGPDDAKGMALWRDATLAWFAQHGAPTIPGVELPR